MKSKGPEEKQAARLWKEGHHELNLAEFPVSPIGGPECKTFEVEDSFEDPVTRERFVRRVTVTGSDKFGLLTPADDDVVLALTHFTCLQGCRDPRVPFTRYKMIQFLGWADSGTNYKRIEETLDRLKGINIYYQRAWWDKGKKKWRKIRRGFSLINNYELSDREGDEETDESYVIWNDVLFRSFQAGYIKSIDMELYRSFQYPIAKRMYRFLDKRFIYRPEWDFDFVQFCHNKLGMSKECRNVAELKRRVLPSIHALEEAGVIARQSSARRFKKSAPGKHRVLFRDARAMGVRVAGDVSRSKDTVEEASESECLVKALIDRGVARTRALELVRIRASADIEAGMRDHDVRKQQRKLGTNSAGWLFVRIRDGGSREVSKLPEDLGTLHALGRIQKEETRRDRELRGQRARAEKKLIKDTVERFLAKLSPEDATQIVLEAGKDYPLLGRDELIASVSDQSKRRLLWYVVIFKHIESIGIAKQAAAP